MNVSVLKKTASIGSSNFHILWLIAELLRRHYKSTNIKFFTPDLSLRLADSIDDWFHIIYKIADSACALAFNRAAFITGDKMQLEVRDFFRGTRNYGGAFANDLILEACDQVLKFTPIVMEDLKKQLPP